MTERTATSWDEMYDEIGDALRLFDAVAAPLQGLAQQAGVMLSKHDLPDFLYEDAAATLEQAIGVAFVAAQAFLVEARGARRRDRNAIFRMGPRTAGGAFVAEVINDAANFWKHAPEWSWDDTDGPLAIRTRDHVDLLLRNSPDTMTPLFELLCIIDPNGRIDALSMQLRTWAESVFGSGEMLFGRQPTTSP